MNNFCIFVDFLVCLDFEFRFEVKFWFVVNLVNSVFDLYDWGIIYGSIGDENIFFCNVVGIDFEVSGII